MKIAYPIPFAAMRRAAGLPPLEPKLTRRPPPCLKPRMAGEILYRGMRLFSQPEVGFACLRGTTISWRLQRNGWSSVRWVTVTEYAPGFIRLRNDVYADIPKRVWPFARPPLREFELTFHWPEITATLGPQVLAFCHALDTEPMPYQWELFQGEATYPQYAWTKAAQLAYPRKN